MAFTEFYLDPAGSNMNGGSSNATTAAYTATNGGWNSGTGVFTPASGDPSASGVTVGAFANVYDDGATTPVFVGRVTAVNSTTITVSTTAKSGTAPTTNATGRSIKVGGAWKGPNGAVGFPYGFITNALKNASGHPYRVSFKNGTPYAITAVMTHSLPGPGVFQGMTATPGDGGKAIIDGGTSGASYKLLAMTTGAARSGLVHEDMIFQNNGDTGSETGVHSSDGGNIFRGCVFNNFKGTGLLIDGYPQTVTKCEVYSCNKSDTPSKYGIDIRVPAEVSWCMIHDNAGANTDGLYVHTQGLICHNVFDTNGRNGCYLYGAAIHSSISECEFYNNGSNGIFTEDFGLGGSYHIKNCNFIKTGCGIRKNTAGPGTFILEGCGFGAGTMANSGGDNNFDAPTVVIEVGTINYASNVTPWTDPANGDFRISLTAAKGAGQGAFTQTASGYAGTVGYPDIGAAQHQETAPTGGGGGIFF